MFAVGMVSGIMSILSIINVISGIQNLLGCTVIHKARWSYKPTFFFQNEESRPKVNIRTPLK
jgi:hypothetical protein